MKIVLVGCGKIGKVILYSLAKENHSITAVDNNASVIDDVRNRYDVMAICGNGTSYPVLKQAGADKCDLFIAATSSDELNMLSCFAARRMGAKHTLARIRNVETNDESLDFMQRELELSMSINPELLTAQAIYNLLKLPAATKLETFSSDQLEMIELLIKPNSPLSGMPLKEIKKKHKGKYLICAVMREGGVIIPNGDFAIQSGDKIGFIVAEDDLSNTLEMMGVPHRRVRRVMIIGASITTKYLAKLLLKHRISVKIVDKDPKACQELCEVLPSKATIICGDGMNQDLMNEEGVTSMDATVSLTGRDEQNMLIAYHAMTQKVAKNIAKINRDELYATAERLGLDGLISPKAVTADLIVKYARALENTLDNHIETLYSVLGGMAQALEFKVLSESKLTNVPLKDLKFKKGVLVAGIIRDKEAIIPGGDDVIQAGDKVIVISAGVKIYDLSDILL